MMLREYRCPNCNKLLFKGFLVDSEVEVKCRGCGDYAMFRGEPKEKPLCFKENCPNRIAIDTARG